MLLKVLQLLLKILLEMLQSITYLRFAHVMKKRQSFCYKLEQLQFAFLTSLDSSVIRYQYLLSLI